MIIDFSLDTPRHARNVIVACLIAGTIFSLGMWYGAVSYKEKTHAYGYIGDRMHCDGAESLDPATHERRFVNCYGVDPK